MKSDIKLYNTLGQRKSVEKFERTSGRTNRLQYATLIATPK